MQSTKESLRKLLQEKFCVGPDSQVLVLGLGIHGGGVGVARFFSRLGFPVTVSDLKSAKELKASLAKLKGLPVRYVLGKHRMEDLRKVSLIIKNPGVPRESVFIKKAESLGVKITNDADIFLNLAPHNKIIGITGTKGKTTTALLTKHLLGKDSVVVGIPGESFFDYFFLKKEPRWIIAEFSSFDLEYVGVSPHIAVITSLFADHLNRYPSFRAYTEAKMNLIRFQERDDLVLMERLPILKKYLPRNLKSEVVRVRAKKLHGLSWRVPPISAALAAAVAKLVGVKSHIVASRLREFDSPTGRLEIIEKKKGRIFINDTTATNPGAASYSLRMLKKKFGRQPFAVITGGEDKSFPEEELTKYAAILRKYARLVLLLPGSMSERLRKYLSKNFFGVYTLGEAVRLASRLPGIVVLLPASASFNMFANEFARAKKFKAEVKKVL